MAIIDEIKEAEKKAAKIKEDAKASARADSEMIENEALTEAANRKAEAAKKAEKLISDAEASAEKARSERSASSERECELIKQAGRQKLDEAAEFIFERAISL